MICRHSEGDPDCTSGKAPGDLLRKGQSLVNRWGGPGGDLGPSPYMNMSDPYDGPSSTAPSPNPYDYEIERVEQVGRYLVVEARYPSCRSCEFEGRKVMVFADTSLKDALTWRQVDPHFRDPKRKYDKKTAPSPVARFPGNEAGWQDALEYAQRKPDKVTR